MLEKETGDENLIGRYGDKARNAEGQMVVDFATRMENGCGEHVFPKEGGAHSDVY